MALSPVPPLSWNQTSNLKISSCFGHLMQRGDSLENSDTGKDGGQKGMTEDEMLGWHHQLNGHEFEQTPGDGEGQGKPGVLQPMGSQSWTQLRG